METSGNSACILPRDSITREYELQTITYDVIAIVITTWTFYFSGGMFASVHFGIAHVDRGVEGLAILLKTEEKQNKKSKKQKERGQGNQTR